MQKICSKCWKREKYCKCAYGSYIELDYNMIYIIKTLNIKGFITVFCCGGHSEKQFTEIYIQFKNNFYFNSIPENFKYKKNKLYYQEIAATRQERQALINHHIKILKDWVNLL